MSDANLDKAPSNDTVDMPDNAAVTPGDADSSSTKKRKEPREYSNNPNTVRARLRLASLPPYRLAVERARSNDMKAVSCAWKERTKTESFMAASKSRKKRILEQVERQIMDRRRRKKIDYDSKVYALNKKYLANGFRPAESPSSMTNDAGESASDLAPPGYLAFPTAQPIAELMEIPKKSSAGTMSGRPTSTDAIGAADSAPGVNDNGTRSTSKPPTTNVEDGSVPSNSTPPAGPATTHPNHELKVIIEELKAQHEDLKTQYETQRRRHKEDEMRREGEIQELRSIIQNTRNEVQDLAGRLNSAGSAYTPTPFFTPTTAYTLSPSLGYTPSLGYPATPGYSPTQNHSPTPPPVALVPRYDDHFLWSRGPSDDDGYKIDGDYTMPIDDDYSFAGLLGLQEMGF
ncbi:hypothetical protein F4802DRAFT_597050 [Xylaria palmicola]|nr:hypothetical protein F4802DRAFT_597050 [Xylaria palmicola]